MEFKIKMIYKYMTKEMPNGIVTIQEKPFWIMNKNSSFDWYTNTGYAKKLLKDLIDDSGS